MKRSGSIRVLLFLLLSLLPAYAHHVAVIVAKGNDVDHMTSANLAKILTADTKRWPDGKNVVVILQRQSAAQMDILGRLGKMSATELKAFLSSHKDSIFLVDSEVELLNLVQSTPGAIGMVDVRSINDKVKVVRVDGKLPMEEGYLPHH